MAELRHAMPEVDESRRPLGRALATSQALDALAALPAAYGVARLAVFGPRPKALAALLQKRGMEANTYSLTDALLKGQVSPQAKTPAPTGAVAAPAPAPESEPTSAGDAA